MPGFVIQRHTGAGAEHYDLMIERSGALATWQLPEPPSMGRTVRARRLPDHRLAYLTYEGPVSGGRGEVRIHDSGSYSEISWDEKRVELRITGGKLDKLSMIIETRSDDIANVSVS